MKLRIQGVAPLQIGEIRLIRNLGGPVEWHFSINATRDSRGGADIAKLATALLEAPAKVFAEDERLGVLRFGSDATVVGAAWKEGAVDRLELRAIGTEVGADSNPFLPRRRVHRVRTMRELVERFKHVSEVSPGVLREMGKIKFADGNSASIVQDGASDWQFVGRILDQCDEISTGQPWLPLTIMGSVSGGTNGKWLIAAGCSKAYHAWRDVKPRKLTFSDRESDGNGRIEFGSVNLVARSSQFAHAVVPTTVYLRQGRKFSPTSWEAWSTQDLPRFLADHNDVMVWRIEDRLYHLGQDTVEWESRLSCIPRDASVCSPIKSAASRPWSGFGKVSADRSAREEWLPVSFIGFESGENAAQVRILTPYSGHDGRKGLHFVPEAGTEVEVRWSGRFDESLILGGNVRRASAVFNSPSVCLEDEYRAQFSDVRILRVDNVNIESALRLGVQQSTKINSTRQLEVRADGADLKMGGGIVRTGRGF